MDKNKAELILGDAFEGALTSAAEVKNQKIASCKSRNKDNYAQFYDLMLSTAQDVQEILSKKAKNRTDAEKNRVKEFKKETSATYRQTIDVLLDEDAEEGAETRVQKMVKRVVSVIKVLEYLGNTEIEREFAKYGVKLEYKKLSEDETFSQDHIKERVEDIFERGKALKDETDACNEEIKDEIYQNSVPSALQYEKSTNPTGIKASDFCKLVDLKAKTMKNGLLDEEKAKIQEKISDMYSEYAFQNEKNDLMRKKLESVTSELGE